MRIEIWARHVVTTLSALYIITVVGLFGRIPLGVFNPLLATVAVPMVWLIGAFARWSAHQHARRAARDIAVVEASKRARVGVR